MDNVQLFSLIISLSALLSYLNLRYLKLPFTIGLMVLSLVLSLGLLLAGSTSATGSYLRHALAQLNFSNLLLDFMLGFLLFAGALHTDVTRLRKARGPIITFATLGTLLSTLLVGGAMYVLLPWLYQPVSFIHCLLFGALISPTDPIAVLSILKKAGVSQQMETRITGESLFNDGVGVVLFLVCFNMANEGAAAINTTGVALLLLREVGGGLLLGLLLGWVGFAMMKRIDHYQTEVLITLALVLGGITLAPLLHVSGPLAMVVAGLLIGNKGIREAMSRQTQEYMHKFWELIDEIFNAILFVLIGLELLLIPLNTSFLYVGVLAIFVLLAVRYLSLLLSSFLIHSRYAFPPYSLLIMTWGGLRGGISIALALSLTAAQERSLFVSVTYIVVLFSILVQGLSLEGVVRRLKKKAYPQSNQQPAASGQ